MIKEKLVTCDKTELVVYSHNLAELCNILANATDLERQFTQCSGILYAKIHRNIAVKKSRKSYQFLVFSLLGVQLRHGCSSMSGLDLLAHCNTQYAESKQNHLV
jgi:hypothetical protein